MVTADQLGDLFCVSRIRLIEKLTQRLLWRV